MIKSLLATLSRSILTLGTSIGTKSLDLWVAVFSQEPDSSTTVCTYLRVLIDESSARVFGFASLFVLLALRVFTSGLQPPLLPRVLSSNPKTHLGVSAGHRNCFRCVRDNGTSFRSMSDNYDPVVADKAYLRANISDVDPWETCSLLEL